MVWPLLLLCCSTGDIAVVECKVVLRSTWKGRLYHDVIATVGVVLLLVNWMGLKGSWIEGFNLMLNVGLDVMENIFRGSSCLNKTGVNA